MFYYSIHRAAPPQGENNMTVPSYHLERYLDNFFNTAGVTGMHSRAEYHQEANETSYTITAPMIGISKADLSVNVENNNLIVYGKPSVKSRWAIPFKQVWALNEDVDVNNINAKLENGLLTLTVPRVKPATRTVNVTVQ